MKTQQSCWIGSKLYTSSYLSSYLSHKFSQFNLGSGKQLKSSPTKTYRFSFPDASPSSGDSEVSTFYDDEQEAIDAVAALEERAKIARETVSALLQAENDDELVGDVSVLSDVTHTSDVVLKGKRCRRTSASA